MRSLKDLAHNSHLRAAAELVLLAGWTLWVGRAFLDPDPDTWPFGWDFALTLEPYHVWGLLSRCGSCVLWNGTLNGGYPAFAEPHAAILHPFVVFPVLLWGTLLGSKVSFVISLFIAGLGQWWLARAMGLRRLGPLWAGAMGIAGGHLAGRMQLGLSGLVLSAACGTLVLAGVVDLALSARRRAAVGLALALALSLLSGQGYVQLGLALAVAPAMTILLVERPIRLNPVWREFALAGLLALLLAGVFLVPFLHFSPQIAKLSDDPLLGAEPLGYVPLNLVLRDLGYYAGMDMERIELPGLYMNYIGWLPLVLALFAAQRAHGRSRRLVGFLGLSSFLAFFLASEELQRILARAVPDIAAAYRYPALVTILSVPPILGLAAWGLEEVDRGEGSRFRHSSPESAGKWLVFRRLLALLVAVAAIRSVYSFGQTWLQTETFPPELRQVAESLRSSFAGWVTPLNEHYWVAYAIEAGNKVSGVYRPWFWRDREEPPAEVVALRSADYPEGARLRATIGDVHILEYPENHYARLETPSGDVECDAQSQGGSIDVTCNTELGGILTIYENAFSGWAVWRDGERVPLQPSNWLQVEAPAGRHLYRFRYRPLDVLVGAGLSLVGILLTTWVWVAGRDRRVAAARAEDGRDRIGV